MKHSFDKDKPKLDEDDLPDSLIDALYTQDAELFKYIFHTEQELKNFESSISTCLRFGPLTISQKQVVIDLTTRFQMKYSLKASDTGTFIDVTKTKSTRCPKLLNKIGGIPHYEEEISNTKSESKPKKKMMLKRKEVDPKQQQQQQQQQLAANIQILKTATPKEAKERSYEEAKKKIYSSVSPTTPESSKSEENGDNNGFGSNYNNNNNSNSADEALKWVENLNLSEEPIKKPEKDIEYSDDPFIVAAKTIEGKGINPNAKPFIPAFLKKSDLKK